MNEEFPLLENDYSFQCPYCWADLFIRLESTGGRKQNFTHDCELCCRPISIAAEFDQDGGISNFSAKTE